MLLNNVVLRAQTLPNAPTGNIALPTHPVPQPLRYQPHQSLHHPHHRRINSAVLPCQTLQRNVGSRALGEIPIVA
jgi:hypothetical protein